MTEDSPNEREPESKQVAGKLLSPEERAVCERLAVGEAPWSQHAQSFLALDAGATQAAAGEQAGLTTGQVKYWLGRFRSDRLDIFPAALLDQTQPEPAQDAEVSPQAAGEEAAATAEKPKQKKKKKKKRKAKKAKGANDRSDKKSKKKDKK